MGPAARLLALAGAVLMPVSLFLHWYEINTGDSTFTSKGWDVFESTDTLMVMVSLATLVVVVLSPRHAGRALLVLGAFMSGWIVVQLIDRPAVIGYFDPGLSVQIGAWLGLLGALLILAAGALSSPWRDRAIVE